MNTLQMLALRRNTALGRLATLEKRAERLAAPAATVMKSALSELSASLEEVQVATEQLQSQMDELGTIRHDLEGLRRRLREFTDVVPVACVWTNGAGEIEEANAAAAELLNVSAQRLAGRALMLFMTERSQFVESLAALNEGLTRVASVDSVIRPRERRPRSVQVVGRRLHNDPRFCWFILDGPPRPHEE